MVKVNIKWNKKVFENVEVDTSAPVSAFKTVIFGLTNVPSERQKLMAKGAWPGTLKDDANMSLFPIKINHQVMLMGTADAIVPSSASVKIVFVEDMSEADKAASGEALPQGFVNLGNTCYMNSVLSVLRYMPDVRKSLSTLRLNPTDSNVALSCQMRDTLNNLDKASEKMPPFGLVQMLRNAFPQYAQQGPQGGYMQQDAEEFYNTLTQMLNTSLPSTSTASASAQDLLQFEFDETIECVETADEPVVQKQSSDKVFKLVCNIQGNVGNSESSNSAPKIANTMLDGIVLNMEGNIEKNSEILQRNALWKKHQKISKLPRFICVQFMRFFWKPTPDNRDHAGVKCKILRPVSYNETFDVYSLCNEKLQKQIRTNKAIKLKATMPTSSSSSDVPPVPAPAPVPVPTPVSDAMEVTPSEEDEEEAALQAALAMSVGGSAPVPPPVPTTTSVSNIFTESNLPSNFTGQYELMGVVTHKGRSADSGHYIGWVRKKEGSDEWFKFDDDVVTEVDTQAILDLKGGGDWHTAYLNFYKFKEN